MPRFAAWKMPFMATQNHLRAVIGTTAREVLRLEPATLDQLAAAMLARRQLDDSIATIAQSCHQGGASWAEIGRVMGVRRQTAWERYADRESDAG